MGKLLKALESVKGGRLGDGLREIGKNRASVKAGEKSIAAMRMKAAEQGPDTRYQYKKNGTRDRVHPGDKGEETLNRMDRATSARGKGYIVGPDGRERKP